MVRPQRFGATPLYDLLGPDGIAPALRADDKKKALLALSELAAKRSGLGPREIYDALLQRERLGSTGIGDGIAIPHGKLARCRSIFGVFARLEAPIPFDALDGAPVDLIFVLIAPEAAGADHLDALSRAARALRDPGTVAAIRATRDPRAVYHALAGERTSDAA